MDWLQSLLIEKSSIAHILLIYAFTIFVGVRLGKVKVLGVSLGVTFVLFVGLVIGHFQLGVDAGVAHFVRDFGLILFIYSIGIQVGPGFFQSFKKGGVLLNGLAVMIVALNIVVMLTIFFADGRYSIGEMVGVLSGAVTNTPGLGAAQQTLLDISTNADAAAAQSESMAMGYAAAYPLGVLGIILSMILVKVFFKVKLEKETADIEAENEQSQLQPFVKTIEVTNALVDGQTLLHLHDIINKNFVVSRLKRPDGDIIIPTSQTQIGLGDKLYIVMSQQDEEVFTSILGPAIDMSWETKTGPVVSRRILVTNSDYNGRKIGSLRLHMGYQLNATRVNRAGLDLLANPNLTLQVGDRITVVGNIDDINRLATQMGNSMKRLHEPNMITLFVGIFLGILVGSIPIALPGMSVPMKLGLAGGPLIVAILISRFGYKMHLVTYTSSSAALLMRELGICLFLASVGMLSGEKFVETVFNVQGATWVAYGFLITFLPLMIVGIIARWKHRLNYYTIMGLMSGSYTDPPALAYGNKTANSDAPAVAYSTVYPLTMFLRIITAQLLILFLA